MEEEAIVDSGACSSVVGQDTLNAAMRQVGISEVPNAQVKQVDHRFGDSEEETKSACAILFPFSHKSVKGYITRFQVHFDVIPGSLPFLIGWPSLKAMRANINCEFMNLGIKVNNRYSRIPLKDGGHHVFLPFKSKDDKKPISHYKPASSSICNQTQSFYRPSDASHDHSRYVLDDHVIPVASHAKPRCHEKFDTEKLKALHLALKHGTATAMEDWLKLSGVWHPELKKSIDELLLGCSCKIAKEPKPHAKVSTNTPESLKQTSVSLDIIFLDGVPVMHAVDKCIGWSETSVLRNRSLDEQVATFCKIWTYRHGIPKKIHADREYFKGDFQKFCKENGIDLVELAANDHEANGMVERANRTLRSFFRRIQSASPKRSVSSILPEATYAKNICKGSKLTSSFQLLYGQHPRIMADIDVSKLDTVTLEAHVESVAKSKLMKMIDTKPVSAPDIKVGDYVNFWRDRERWIGPAQVVEVGDNIVKFVYGEKTMTSSFNRVQKTEEPVIPDADDDYDDVPPLPSLGETPKPCKSVAFEEPINKVPGEKKSLNPAKPREPVATRSRTKELSKNASNKEILPWISGELYSFPTFSSHSKISTPEKVNAYNKEKKNWLDMRAMSVVPISSVPPSANIVGSHVRYIRKMNGSIKARICPWGNHDIDKYDLRTDAPSMLMEVLRLVVSIGVENDWDIGSMDIRAAFLQALGFNRTIYVRPPKEEGDSGLLWKLLAAAYGLVDSGRLWYLTSNAALCDLFGLVRSKYEPTLYFSRNKKSQLDFIVVVQVDNYIYAGTESRMADFEKFLRDCFEVGEISRNNFEFYGATVTRLENRTVIIDQNSKLQELSELDLDSGNKSERSGNDLATEAEMKKYRRAIGKILFVGRMSHPALLRIASTMATKVSMLQSHHLKDLQAQVKQALRNAPVLTYCSTKDDHQQFAMSVYSDGSPGSKKDEAARGGFILFRRHGDTVHPIYWSSRRLRRVARSSSTAEILSAADAVDKSYYISALAAEVSR